MRYLKKLFGYFLLKAHGITGAIVPTRKKNTSGLINVDDSHALEEYYDLTSRFDSSRIDGQDR